MCRPCDCDCVCIGCVSRKCTSIWNSFENGNIPVSSFSIVASIRATSAEYAHTIAGAPLEAPNSGTHGPHRRHLILQNAGGTILLAGLATRGSTAPLPGRRKQPHWSVPPVQIKIITYPQWTVQMLRMVVGWLVLADCSVQCLPDGSDIIPVGMLDTSWKPFLLNPF